MHLRNWLFLVICCGAAAATSVMAEQSDPGWQVLLADDGFASLGDGTTSVQVVRRLPLPTFLLSRL